MLKLILVCIASISAFRYNYIDPRIYSFAFTGVRPGSFFDGEKLTGVRVELMKEVCCRAAKRCVGAFVPFNKCLDKDTLSPVLDNRWHDACINVADTPRRAATFAFSNITFFYLGPPALIVRNDSNITLDDLRNPRNNIKVAFMSAPHLVPSVSLERFLEEFFVKPENVIPVAVGGPIDALNIILKRINDACAEQMEIVGLVPYEVIHPKDGLKVLKFLGGPLGRPTMMVRKDEQDILDWWDYTLKRFMCSPDYAKFCDRMDNQFGPHPINCPDPKQVDCNDCSRPHRVPGCPCPADQ